MAGGGGVRSANVEKLFRCTTNEAARNLFLRSVLYSATGEYRGLCWSIREEDNTFWTQLYGVGVWVHAHDPSPLEEKFDVLTLNLVEN